MTSADLVGIYLNDILQCYEEDLKTANGKYKVRIESVVLYI